MSDRKTHVSSIPKYKCENCGNAWKLSELLFEPELNMFKCRKCRVFTPLIKEGKNDR